MCLLRVRSVPLGVDRSQVSALLHRHVEAAGAEAVEDGKVDLASDADGAVAAALLGVDAGHGFGPLLQRGTTHTRRSDGGVSQ